MKEKFPFLGFLVRLCVVELYSNVRLNGHRFEVKRFLRGSQSLQEKLTKQLAGATRIIAIADTVHQYTSRSMQATATHNSHKPTKATINIYDLTYMMEEHTHVHDCDALKMMH